VHRLHRHPQQANMACIQVRVSSFLAYSKSQILSSIFSRARAHRQQRATMRLPKPGPHITLSNNSNNNNSNNNRKDNNMIVPQPQGTLSILNKLVLKQFMYGGLFMDRKARKFVSIPGYVKIIWGCKKTKISDPDELSALYHEDDSRLDALFMLRKGHSKSRLNEIQCGHAGSSSPPEPASLSGSLFARFCSTPPGSPCPSNSSRPVSRLVSQNCFCVRQYSSFR
jgi:hypothetical protein